jgi:hypothetical protein
VHGTNAKGETVKSHTDYRINEREAETIQGIFRAYADGYGHTAIAKRSTATSPRQVNGTTLKRCTANTSPDAIPQPHSKGTAVPAVGHRAQFGKPSTVRAIAERFRMTAR